MDSYAYIVAGAGSAGAVVASRLSEDASVRVLLIEAGGSHRHLNVQMPAVFPKQFKTAAFGPPVERRLDSQGRSGQGRELGADGLRKFFYLKSIQR